MSRLLLYGSHLLAVVMAADMSLLIDDPGSNISAVISPSFAGFGIEPSDLFAFLGGQEANNFSLNLFRSLASHTGKPPHIRLGGNTQDYIKYNETVDDWRLVANPDMVGPGAYASDASLVGPRYFEAANRMPQGTPVTWGLNMGYDADDCLDYITAMAEQVLARCTNLDLTSFEIGNEPDLYNQNGFRKGPWSGAEYTREWLTRASAIYDKVLKPRALPSNKFEPGVTAFTAGTTFEIEKLLQDGIDAQANGSSSSFVYAWSQHNYYYFVGITNYQLTLEDVTQWKTTEDRLAQWSDQLVQARATGLPFVLREMAVVGPLGLEGISNTFAAALWTLNFLLYSAALNISSVQFHMTANSNASAWQPVAMYGRDPFVRPLYYGMAAFGQAIGPASGTPQVSMAMYDMADFPSDYDGVIKAYSIFQQGSLSSVAVINGRVASVSTSDKASITVKMTLPTSFAGQTLYLSHLTSDGADATSGTTWNGVSFEKSGDGTPTQVADDSTTVGIGDDGRVTFTVRDSEAVVAKIGSSPDEENAAGVLRACWRWHDANIRLVASTWAFVVALSSI